jgi:hypothetical protein
MSLIANYANFPTVFVLFVCLIVFNIHMLPTDLFLLTYGGRRGRARMVLDLQLFMQQCLSPLML